MIFPLLNRSFCYLYKFHLLYELIFYQLLGVALNMIIYLIENNIVELLDITENQN